MRVLTDLFHLGLLSIVMASGLPASGHLSVRMSSLRAQASTVATREDQLQKQATDLINEGKWDAAANKFGQVAELSGKLADGAIYWKAYALNKAGHRQEALAAIADLRKQYPRSTWLKDAGALEIELRQASGQPINLQEQNDEETKLLALNSLMDSDPNRALPILLKFLAANNSLQLKEQALFVLAQSDSPEAHQTLIQVARGQSHPELQKKAIEYLASKSSIQNVATLGEIYHGSNNSEVRRAVLNAFVDCSCHKELLAVAQGEHDAELRREAIQHLGEAGGREELRQLYKSATSEDDKEAIIQGFMAADDIQRLSELAKTATEARVKASAIQGLGDVGGQESKALLLQIYISEKDPQMKRSAVDALFTQGDAHDLIQLTRNERDPELRKYLIQQLSVMHDREAKDYVLELLNK